MVLKGTILRCVDNSGCGSVKVIQLYSCCLCHAGELVRCVMHKFNPNRNKLQKSKHYMVAFLAALREFIRMCAQMIWSAIHKIVLISENQKRLLGTRINGIIQRESRDIGLEMSVLHRIILFARLII
jgi:ribosomal protein L14